VRMNHSVHVIKSDGTSELFEESKLVESLTRVKASPEAIDEITDEIGREIHEGMTTAEVYRRAFELLRKHSVQAAAKYSVRRALTELGPDGFPFEKFVARIFTMWEYEAVTDQTLMGESVDHEVDVVAWKGDNLAMVEAKFHNEFGMKSDLKVVLYVKARYDDLVGKEFDYGGKKRKLSERWVATNTKFTDKAITYGEHYGLKLLGWNYPADQNLHHIIAENGLHPITCMTTLSRDQKKDLIGHGVLVCVDIVGRPSVLHDIGIKPENVERILTEAQVIIEEAK
jgi:hypothetical protein